MIYEHPNRRAFTGELTILDKPSDGRLQGAIRSGERKDQSRHVILPRAVAKRALPTLLGMPINWSEELTHHSRKRIGGIITDAEIIGDRIHVCGYVFGVNRLVEVAQLQRHDLGMSFEAAPVRIADMREEIWTIDSLIFTGATVAKKAFVAFKDTSFDLKPISAKVPVELAAQTGTEFICA